MAAANQLAQAQNTKHLLAPEAHSNEESSGAMQQDAHTAEGMLKQCFSVIYWPHI